MFQTVLPEAKAGTNSRFCHKKNRHRLPFCLNKKISRGAGKNKMSCRWLSNLGAAVRLQVEGNGKRSRGKLVFLPAVAALDAFAANWRTGFVRPVGKQQGCCGRAVGVAWKNGFLYIGGAHVVEVIGIGKAVHYFKTHVDAFVEGVFDAHAKRYAKGHGAVLLPFGVGCAALPFGAQLPQVVLLALQVSKRVVVEHAHAQRYIRREVHTGFARQKPVKVEIALQRKLVHVGVEAQVSAAHEFVVIIINVRISQPCIIGRHTGSNVIAKIFPKENAGSHFGPVYPNPCVEIAEIMTGAHRYAKLTLLHY